MIGAAEVLPVIVGSLALLSVIAVTSCSLGPWLRGPQPGDAAYWNGSSGFIAVVIVIVVAGQAAPHWIPLFAAVTIIAGAAAAGSLWVYWGRRRAAAQSRELRECREQTSHRHDEVLRRWLAYELEPDMQIDYPLMADVAYPPTAALVRSMRRAATLRREAESAECGEDLTGRAEAGADAADAGRYEFAVLELERCFQAAEESATRADSPLSTPAVPTSTLPTSTLPSSRNG